MPRVAPFDDELRLLLTIILNGFLLCAAYRLARRRLDGGRVAALCDAILLYFLAQYAAVALPGVAGCLSLTSMAAAGFLIGGVFWWLGGKNPNLGAGADAARPARSTRPAPGDREKQRRTRLANTPTYLADIDADSLGLIAAALFVLWFLLVYAWINRDIPPVATDPLVYHLPTAIQWMQTGRVGIYPSWYWNPAASYSPATGSMFMAWWMILLGNDALVRYVQIPPLLLIFFICVRIGRLMGMSRTLAGLIATAAVMSRPLLSEALFAKDDLFATAFVAAGVLALAPEAFRGRGGAGRAGLAFGFVLASKYTILLACPVFLFLLDSLYTLRWRWRQGLMAAGIVLAMAGPWYARNLLLSGNPLYPVDIHILGLRLPGLFSPERDQQLRQAQGVLTMLASTYHSLPALTLVPLAIAWLAALIFEGKTVVRQPLPRACVIGSAATLAIFLATSPHHEVRYVFPLIVLWFIGAGWALSRTFGPRWQIAAGLGLALLSASTGFGTRWLAMRIAMALIAGVALSIAGAILVIVLLQRGLLRLKRRRVAAAVLIVSALFVMYAYTQWSAYLKNYEEDRWNAWEGASGYPWQAPLWRWADANLPADARIAYANTFFVYPFAGFRFGRRVDYAPVRDGVRDFFQTPRLGESVPGDLLVNRMTQAMDENPDEATWRANLMALHAQYLIVVNGGEHNPDLDPHPPELTFARHAPAQFELLHEDPAGSVYQIHLEPSALP